MMKGKYRTSELIYDRPIKVVDVEDGTVRLGAIYFKRYDVDPVNGDYRIRFYAPVHVDETTDNGTIGFAAWHSNMVAGGIATAVTTEQHSGGLFFNVSRWDGAAAVNDSMQLRAYADVATNSCYLAITNVPEKSRLWRFWEDGHLDFIGDTTSYITGLDHINSRSAAAAPFYINCMSTSTGDGLQIYTKDAAGALVKRIGISNKADIVSMTMNACTINMNDFSLHGIRTQAAAPAVGDLYTGEIMFSTGVPRIYVKAGTTLYYVTLTAA